MVSLVLLFFSIHSDSMGADAPEPSKEKRQVLDFDAPPETNIELLPGLKFGAQTEVEFIYQKNFDLDRRAPDDFRRLDPELEFAFSYTPVEKVAFFLDFELVQEIVDDETNERNDRTLFELKEAYVLFQGLIEGVDLQVGRQSFKDKRQWLYDEEMDAIRLSYSFSGFMVDLSVSQDNDEELIHRKDGTEVTNVGLTGGYAFNEDTSLAAYVLFQDGRENTNESPTFFGLHANGEIFDNLEYWLELAHVRGRSGPDKIRGYGFDLGSTYTFELPLEPSITLGYAFGSGDDDPTSGRDGNFRQTGLQDNEAKFNGVTRIKYYGETFDPELSNLGIFTSGIGIRPLKGFSLDFVYHHYRQQEPVAAIRNSNLNRDPSGLSSNLGQEFDLVAGFKTGKHFKAQLALGYFQPGEAFTGVADDAFSAGVEIQFEL
jgi:alginate production protein